MSLLGILIFVCVLVMIFGNPHIGPHVYQGYSYGYWPGGLGLLLVIFLLFLLFR
jgi:hypothetical protein